MKPEQILGCIITLISLVSGIISIFTMEDIQIHFAHYWGFYSFGLGILSGLITWISSKFSEVAEIAHATYAFDKRLQKEIEFIASESGTLQKLREFQDLIASNQDIIGNAKLPNTEE